uniref:Uncharacterized protein n=2 Tax=Oryza TaxID=4527 RepID=A0A0D9ZMH9_9ORYZ
MKFNILQGFRKMELNFTICNICRLQQDEVDCNTVWPDQTGSNSAPYWTQLNTSGQHRTNPVRQFYKGKTTELQLLKT